MFNKSRIKERGINICSIRVEPRRGVYIYIINLLFNLKKKIKILVHIYIYILYIN